MDVANVLQFDLTPVPPMLVKCLGVSATTPPAADIVLVDAGQLLYHVVWPVAGTAEDLATSFDARLATAFLCPLKSCYSAGMTKKLLAQGIDKAVRLTPNTLLPCR